MGKNPLNENAVKTIRRLVQHKPLHSLLLNLSVDLMLRASDLLKMRVGDVISETGVVKDVVKVKQQKTGKTTIDIPLSDNSKRVIQEHLLGKQAEDFIFVGNKSNYTKVLANAEEIKARSGKLIAIVTQGDTKMNNIADHIIEVPETHHFLTPLITALPLQLLSYHIAKLRGCDVDQPRNLAKSVTVE